MILHVAPASSLKGQVDLPASKSYSIRAFMIAACGGNSVIIHPSDCDDARVALKTARALGSVVRQEKDNVWHVRAGERTALPRIIPVGESGTVLRFLLPQLAVRGIPVRVSGEGTLVGRPNAFLLKALRRLGIDIRGRGSNESVPIVYKGGSWKGRQISIDGSLSSQFISALLIACPLLSQDSRVDITGKTIVSRDYMTMTTQVLERSGIDVQSRGPRTYQIKGGQTYKGLKRFEVPSDYGLAAFLLAAAALVPSNLHLKGYLTDAFVQADGHIMSFLNRMGVAYDQTSRGIRIKGPAQLKGGDFSLKDCPDLVPIMSVLALFARGRTRLYNIHHAKAKESDRISDLRRELLKIGADVRETSSELIIYPKPSYVGGVTLDPYHDHRLAMAFSVLGLRVGLKVKDIECVSKSYPGFVRDMKAIGASVNRRRV